MLLSRTSLKRCVRVSGGGAGMAGSIANGTGTGMTTGAGAGAAIPDAWKLNADTGAWMEAI